MANVHRKKFAHGLRNIWGNGDVVHQTKSGKTIVAAKPLFDEHLSHDEKQIIQHAAIRDAALYASFAENQDAYVNRAAELCTTAYALAVVDWFGAPRVLQIDVDHWSGKPGQTIPVKARDNVMVASVMLVIRDAKGEIQEMGEALPYMAGGAWWHYTTQLKVSMTPFPTVQAIAFDLAGNRGSFTVS